MKIGIISDPTNGLVWNLVEDASLNARSATTPYWVSKVIILDQQKILKLKCGKTMNAGASSTTMWPTRHLMTVQKKLLNFLNQQKN